MLIIVLQPHPKLLVSPVALLGRGCEDSAICMSRPRVAGDISAEVSNDEKLSYPATVVKI